MGAGASQNEGRTEGLLHSSDHSDQVEVVVPDSQPSINNSTPQSTSNNTPSGPNTYQVDLSDMLDTDDLYDFYREDDEEFDARGDFLYGEMNDHFILNGRPELSLLSALGFRLPPPPIHKLAAVECPVNIKLNTLEIVQEPDSNLYRTKFLFDSSAKYCSIQVLYNVTGAVSSVWPSSTSISKSVYGSGLNQMFTISRDKFLDVTTALNDETQFACDSETGMYPITIVIEVESESVANDKYEIEEGNKSRSGSKSRRSSHASVKSKGAPKLVGQATFCALVRSEDDTFSIKPMVQRLLRSDGMVYVVQDIFGAGEDAPQDTQRDCVICMSDPRNTALLPCRHMCLCKECAEELREKASRCPICRATIFALVEVDLNPSEPDASSKPTDVAKAD